MCMSIGMCLNMCIYMHVYMYVCMYMHAHVLVCVQIMIDHAACPKGYVAVDRDASLSGQSV